MDWLKKLFGVKKQEENQGAESASTEPATPVAEEQQQAETETENKEELSDPVFDSSKPDGENK